MKFIKNIIYLILLTLFLFPQLSGAGENRPKIGLVLGGGGAKGNAHVGVLKVIEELKIPIDYIAGTSMGAIVGSLYASGKSPSEIESLLTAIDWDDVFNDNPDRRDISFRRREDDFIYLTKLQMGLKDGSIRMPKAIIGGQKVGVLFESLLSSVAGINDFDKLPIPFRAVASDLESGEMGVIKSGSLALAARASMSVPGVFPPVELGDMYLVDGGILRNLPVDVVRDMGAEVVIAVDVSNLLAKRDKLTSPISVLNQMLDVMILKNVQEQIDSLTDKDILILPQLGDITSVDFKKGVEAAELGKIAAISQSDMLRKYSVDEKEFNIYVAHKKRVPLETIKVDEIEVKGLVNVSDSYVKSKIKLSEGDLIHISELQKQVGLIYGSGDFERVDMEIMPSQRDGYKILLNTKEKEWGPNYLRLGVNLESSFGTDSSYNILVDYTMRWLNRLGAEWKNQLQFGNVNAFSSQFYQPLEASQTYFIAPQIGLRQELVDLFEGNKRVAQYRLTKMEGGFDLGAYIFDNKGKTTLSVVRGYAKANPRIGNIMFESRKVNYGGIKATLTIDQLDNVNFPHNGYYANLGIYNSIKALGSEDTYSKVEAMTVNAITSGKNTFLLSLYGGAPIINSSPFYDLYTLGGFLSLSGLHNRQIIGQYAGLSRLIYYRQIDKTFLGDFYIGGSLEAGNVWATKKDISLRNIILSGSVFVGADTIFGPLYFAFGKSEGANQALYLYLGRTF